MGKEILGREIAQKVKEGEVLGIGTGSTVDAAIIAIGDRIKKEGLKVFGVTSSRESSNRCREVGITVLELGVSIDWGFDGADFVTDKLQCLKGKGAALLREKILAHSLKKFIVIADDSKFVQSLDNLPIPVETLPPAEMLVRSGLKSLGATEITLREGTGKFGGVVTEFGNIILDVKFPKVTEVLSKEIKCITGVVDHGLFLNEASEVWIGSKDSIKKFSR
jgi:ribose 5-phosphate isomerase A